MKKTIRIIGLALCLLALLCACKKKEEKQEELLSGKHHVEITIKDKGVIALELDADKAPITVTNFVNLAKQGFYDGTTFHRIIKGFMMQGGAYTDTGIKSSGTKIKGEFAANGVTNEISHLRGTISMGRTAYDYNSASCQFFIVHKDYPSLDGQYAAFGYVTSGIEIVDEICDNVVNTDNNGGVAPADRPVIESVKVID